ncbi:hypothetical protein AGMMS50256_01730 [Betaproteobacteria bacterium]|nr:hypothetical protein AGMMS50256_01730 [Betaproteobacteria bacterium]
MNMKQTVIFSGLASLLLSSATLAQEVDVKNFRKMLIEQNAYLCNQMHAEIKSEATRKQYCNCVFTEFYSKISDAEIIESVSALDELDRAGREGRAKRKSSPEEKQKELRKVEEENKRLAATEQACMKKYDISGK